MNSLLKTFTTHSQKKLADFHQIKIEVGYKRYRATDKVYGILTLKLSLNSIIYS